MKKLIITLFTISAMGIATMAYAYGSHKHGNHGQKQDMMFTMMEKMLDLSEQQVDEISQIRKQMKASRAPNARKPSMHQIMSLNPNAPDYDQQVSEIAAARAEHAKAMTIKKANMHAEIYRVLTPEQQSKLLAFREQMHAKMSARRAAKAER